MKKTGRFDRVLRPHQQQTIRRSRCETQVLVVHDTTEFRFSSPREDLGFLTGNTKDQGFYGHFSLALGGEDFGTPLGIINTQLHFKKQKKGYLTPAGKRKDPTR